ncbi:M56 family metallopeptidase [Myxococcus sp. AS-1-15]|uniref:M56 family metallopeptidase n=1 Tax=Myxococcus sp. AS-1-15 TaxID=2874600 RepID=UPI001CBC7B04|nr:M56 family metallopeptidase [Myxococcus sp. AS-1-15]MBZ4400917.1 M56 family metallopeptidase [Myxococcus sp. AS-1-15]
MHVLDALERALIDFVWQGGAVALVVAGLLAMMSRRSAKGRYVVACLGLATMAVLPLVTFLRALMEGPAAAASLGLAPQALAPAAVAREVVVADLAPTAEVTVTWLELLRPWLLPAWCAGVLLLSARTLVSWYAAQRLSRLHTREPDSVWREAMERALAKLRMSRPVRLMASTRIDVPQVIGLWRPLILVPAGAITGLSPQQLEAVLSHELAHIQRHDYLVNLLQALVETFLFYHPAVWWLSHRIREEREHCADDQAVQSCGDAVLYARALAHIEQLRAPPSALLALGADGGSLLGRIRRLLSVPDTRAPRRSWRLVSGLGGAALAVALGSSQVPMTAMAVAPQALDVAPVAKHERAFTEVTPPVHRPLVAPAPRILPLDLTSKTPSRPTRVLHKVSTAPRKAREPSPRPLLIPDTQGIARTQLPRTPYPLDVEPSVPSEAVAVESHETPVDEAPVDEAQVEHDSISMQVMAAALPALTPATTPPAAPTPPRPQPEDDGAFTLGPGITPPRFVSGQRLAFQDITQNLRSRISAVPKGSIVTRCTITAEGSVTNCKSLQSLSGLEEGVIRTLTTWRYEPATLDGKPVPVHYEFDIWFTNEPGGGRDQQLASADKPGKRADGSSQSACILCASVSASSVATPPVAGF